MKLSELKKEIFALGFSDQIDSADLLICSINRALRDLYSRRSILRTVRLFSPGQKPRVYHKEIKCINGKPITYELNGRAFTMRLCGMGFYKIVDASRTIVTDFNTGRESQLVRGFISGRGTIEFYGSTSFTVYDFSVYDEIFYQSALMLPDGGKTVEINLREEYKDFLCFVSPVQNSDGEVIKNAKLSDGKIILPSDYRGEFLVTYRRLPTAVVNDESHVIDVPEEYCHLFPLLAAFYIWLDIDETKANYYREEYEKLMSLAEREGYWELDSSYTDTNGWS